MKVCYVSFKLDNPRDRITLKGLRVNGIEVREVSFNGYFRLLKNFRHVESESDLVMVGYASSMLVIFLRLFTRKRIIYNALATFYDSMVISRGKSLIWYWIIDFLAFNSANKIFLECQAQKDLVVRVFRVNTKKISVHFVGTDDREFYFDPTIRKLNQFTVVFRGMFLPEAGANVVIRAAKELEQENIRVRILGRGLLQAEIEQLMRELKPTNVELVTERLPIEVLRTKMLECHLSLGQLADHPRVHTTIPHKAFESMAMKLPYLTGNNMGIMEVLKDGETCFTVPPGDHMALARKIIELKNLPQDLDRVTENAYELYQRKFTPKILASVIIEELQALAKEV
jgi:glycosyltransferase involved in cell wall biosynthesis